MASETQSESQPPAQDQASATQTPARTALDFNLPKGENFLVNPRGQRLHVRTFLPAPGTVEIKALLVWCHGYAAHVNGPTMLRVMEGMNKKGFAVIALDHHGHGYRCEDGSADGGCTNAVRRFGLGRGGGGEGASFFVGGEGGVVLCLFGGRYLLPGRLGWGGRGGGGEG